MLLNERKTRAARDAVKNFPVRAKKWPEIRIAWRGCLEKQWTSVNIIFFQTLCRSEKINWKRDVTYCVNEFLTENGSKGP